MRKDQDKEEKTTVEASKGRKEESLKLSASSGKCSKQICMSWLKTTGELYTCIPIMFALEKIVPFSVVICY